MPQPKETFSVPAKRKASRPKLRTLCFSMLFAGTLLQATACHRSYYRRQADSEAVQLITEKSDDPHWALPDRSIDIDPRSRMAHPFSEDHAPMPPDDPSSNEFMRRVDGKPGYPHWEANGKLSEVENPTWLSFVPLNEDGELVLDLNRSVRVAYLHSPNYQNQRETLYQSALDVSLERFAFDAQLFSSYNSFLTTDGRIRGGGNSRTTIESGTGARGVRLQKLGITGSTLVVGLANTLLWSFSGPNSNQTNSLVDFSFIQPLLRGAGRDRIMEGLTQAERSLLANIRQMERFRRGFYLNIVTGRGAGQGPSLGGNFLGTPGSQGNNAGGFLGLLQARQNIFIQEYNVAQLRDVVEQFRFLQQAERISALQVTQVETNLYQQQNNLFSAIANYEAQLDSFKINLGLPPELKIDIADPLLDEFQLIDPSAIRQQDEINRLKQEISEPLLRIAALMEDGSRTILDKDADGNPTADIVGVKWDEVLEKELKEMNTYIDKVEAVRKKVIEVQEKRILDDIEALRDKREDRIANLRKLSSVDLDYGRLEDEENATLREELIGEQAIVRPEELEAAVEKAVKELEGKIADDLEGIRLAVDQILETHSDPALNKQILEESILKPLPQSLGDISSQSLELLLEQVLARTDLVQLPEVNLDSDVAIAIAKVFRRDWMNARASLVDSWRQIEFQADQLESTFDLVFEGDIGTVGDNPINFRTANGRLRGGFRFDSPITRLQERNNYRVALIQYQQARRQYYQVRDEIARNLRQILRQIELNKVLFELNRLQIKVGVRQVDQARLAVSQPAGVGGRGSNPTLGRDLTEAINTLQQAQTRFLNGWVSYEVQRRGLDFDLGTMQLDEDSLWIDPGTIDRDFVQRLIDQDNQLLQEMGLTDFFIDQEDFDKATQPDLEKKTEAEKPEFVPRDPDAPFGESSPAATDPAAAEPLPGRSPDATVPDAPRPELTPSLPALDPQQDAILQLKQQLREELIRNAELSGQRASADRAAANLLNGEPGVSGPNVRTSQLPSAASGGARGAGSPPPPIPTNPAARTGGARLPSVDVTQAFPRLPEIGTAASPTSLAPTSPAPASVPPSSARRFQPILPE